MEWTIQTADSFLRQIKKHKKHRVLLTELDNKLKRLCINPYIIGIRLSGDLHGKQSTGLTGKFRLIFRIDDKKHTIWLVALDHRANVY